MWSVSINRSIPINAEYDYRLTVTATRDAEPAPQPEYDTDAIFLWQKDESHPEGTPQIVEYFTNVCSVADLTLMPLSGGAELQYRKNTFSMVFRSEALLITALDKIITDIEQLKQAILDVDSVVTDGDFDTA